MLHRLCLEVGPRLDGCRGPQRRTGQQAVVLAMNKPVKVLVMMRIDA